MKDFFRNIKVRNNQFIYYQDGSESDSVYFFYLKKKYKRNIEYVKKDNKMMCRYQQGKF